MDYISEKLKEKIKLAKAQSNVKDIIQYSSVFVQYYLFLSFLIQRSQVSNMATYIMLIFNIFFNIAIAKIIWSKRMS